MRIPHCSLLATCSESDEEQIGLLSFHSWGIYVYALTSACNHFPQNTKRRLCRDLHVPIRWIQTCWVALYRDMQWQRRPRMVNHGGKHSSCRLLQTGDRFEAIMACSIHSFNIPLKSFSSSVAGTGMWPSSGSGWIRGLGVGLPRTDLTVPCRLWKPGRRLFWTAGTATLSSAATARRYALQQLSGNVLDSFVLPLSRLE